MEDEGQSSLQKTGEQEVQENREEQMGMKYQALDQCTLGSKFVLNSDWLSMHTYGNLPLRIHTWVVKTHTLAGLDGFLDSANSSLTLYFQ